MPPILDGKQYGFINWTPTFPLPLRQMPGSPSTSVSAESALLEEAAVAYAPVSMVGGPSDARLNSLWVVWLLGCLVFVPTGLATALLGLNGIPVNLGGLSAHVTIFLPLVFCTACVLWFGYLWGAIPAFVATLLVALFSGVPVLWAIAFAATHPVGLAVLALAYRVIPLRTDMRSVASAVFFVLVSFVAAIVSSSGSFVYTYTSPDAMSSTFATWQGWWIGCFLQAVLINLPIFILLTPSVTSWKRSLRLGLRPVGIPSRGAVLTACFVVMAALIGYTLVVHYFSMLHLQGELDVVRNTMMRRDIMNAVAGLALIHWVLILVIAASVVFWHQIVVRWTASITAYAGDLSLMNGQLEREIAERQRTETELKKSAAKLEESNIGKDRFLQIISHDLRAPMGSILSVSSFLTENFNQHDKTTVREMTEIIHRAAENLFGLMENLLEWARLRSGHLQAELEVMDLQQLTEASIGLLRRQAELKGIKVENRVPESTFVRADVNMMRSVLINLLSNAIKYSERGDDVDVYATDRGDKVRVVVRDSGIGMTQTQLKRLFRMDRATSTKGTANEPGSGIGLVLCKEMIEKHGDVLEVESVLHRGTMFKFSLPSAEAPEKLAPAYVDRRALAAPRRAQQRTAVNGAKTPQAKAPSPNGASGANTAA